MQMRTSLDAWALSFLSVIGLSAGCGADVTSDGGNRSAALDAGGVNTGTGGVNAGGGAGTGTAGTASGGAYVGTAGTASGYGTGGAGYGARSSGTGGTVSIGTGGSVNVPPPIGLIPCVNPKPLEVAGQPSNLVVCENGMIHRPESAACVNNINYVAVQSVDGGFGDCSQDSDCGDAPNGYCRENVDFVYALTCESGCLVDSDCLDNQVCICGQGVGRCEYSQCLTNDDCEGAALCTARSQYGCDYHAVPMRGFACQTPEDRCSVTAECSSGLACVFAEGLEVQDYRSCAPHPGWVCGRPFLVACDERRANSVLRDDWLGDGATVRDSTASVLMTTEVPVEETLEAEILHRWRDIALMEHASVAAFSRFSLQLMFLGAPPDLIRRSQQASLDEVRHAEFAFARATHYAGAAVGPGALSMQGALDDCDLYGIAELTILEGCVGETIAAVEATEAACLATGADLRCELLRIAEEEQAHASLAWDTLRWLLQEHAGDQRLLATVRRAFDNACSQRSCESDAPVAALGAHGLIAGSLRREIHERVRREVIAPASRRLLASTQDVAA
ncbi:MAG: hypothetical protein HRU17_17750 [Polyangiaceae bacterium]|nr:hypothetical protein [Polyangiaceae bacterium]